MPVDTLLWVSSRHSAGIILPREGQSRNVKHIAHRVIQQVHCYGDDVGSHGDKVMSMNPKPSLADLKEFMTSRVPYWQTLGLHLKEVAPGRAVFEAAALPGLMQNKVLHGGVLASVADSACAVAAISLVFPTSYATTINLHVSYLRPVMQGRFRAEGKCVKAGKNVMFCDAQVFDESGSLVCAATSQLMVIRNE